MIRTASFVFLLAVASSQALASNWTTAMDNKRKCETAAHEAQKARVPSANHYVQCAKEFETAARYFRENDQSYNGKTAFQRGLDQYNRGNMR